MIKSEHIELLKSMGFYEEIPDKWVKDYPGIGSEEEFTDCLVVWYPEDTAECYIGGNQILSGTTDWTDLDLFEEKVMNNYCTQEEKDVCWPLFEQICVAKRVIIRALGTSFKLIEDECRIIITDEESKNAVKHRVLSMCLDILNSYGVNQSAFDQWWEESNE